MSTLSPKTKPNAFTELERKEVMWNVASAGHSRVATLNLEGFEEFIEPTRQLFLESTVPYSGIILSNSVSEGEDIEKSCYMTGGFKQLFKSYDNVALDCEFPLNALVKMLRSVATHFVKHYRSEGSCDVVLDLVWAVCQRENDYGTLHNHFPDYLGDQERYSGVLYLETPHGIGPRTFPNGCLHIVVDNSVLYYPPIPGVVVVWPSKVLHGIHPFRGEGQRTAIAFDFYIGGN